MRGFQNHMQAQHGVDLSQKAGDVPYAVSILAGDRALAELEQVGDNVTDVLIDRMEGHASSMGHPTPGKTVDWSKILKSAAVAIGHYRAIDAIEHTLTLMGAPYGRNDVDDSGIILCRMNDMKKALGLVYGTVQGESPVRQFTIFHDGNHGLPGDAAPAALHVREDGSAVAVWADDEGLPSYSIAYDADGTAALVCKVGGVSYSETDKPPFDIPPLGEVAGELGVSIGERQQAIRDAWSMLNVDESTHKATVANDCVIVRELRTNKVDNPHGPAIILADGRMRFFRDGVKFEPPTSVRNAENTGPAAQPAA